MLRIEFADILRATLPARSGNEGWIGVSPKGDQYHIVVPVDRQIARGVMACNLPKDGTPFGGYSGWLYFPCTPYDDEDETGEASDKLRVQHARASADSLIKWLNSYEVEARVTGDKAVSHESGGEPSSLSGKTHGSADRAPLEPDGTSEAPDPLLCDTCGKSWKKIGDLLRDSSVRLDRYHACLEDFSKGSYIFAHSCGGSVNLPVNRLARPASQGTIHGG